MTSVARPWSGMEVEQKMAEVYLRLDDAVATYGALIEEAAHKRHEFKRQSAQYLMAAKADENLKTDALRKAWVDLQTDDAELEADIADGLVKAHREIISSLHHQCDLLRSMARSNRDMHDSPGWGSKGG
jgi:hypothetical protein